MPHQAGNQNEINNDFFFLREIFHKQTVVNNENFYKRLHFARQKGIISNEFGVHKARTDFLLMLILIKNVKIHFRPKT